MAGRAPISGLAVALAAAGVVVLYSGLNNVPVTDTLRGFIKGQPPKPQPQQTALGAARAAVAAAGVAAASGAAAGGGPAIGGGEHADVAQDAAKYLGIAYRFGGADPSGFDCSGLVTWVLHHDLGYQLPSNSHTVTGQFYTWNGAHTISRDLCAAGDLVCWPSHIGIAIDNGHMIHAPQPGEVVKVGAIWNVPPPIIRRLGPAPSGKNRAV